MKNKMRLLIAVGLLTTVSASAISGQYSSQSSSYRTMHHMRRTMTARQHEVYDAMRKLWEDHVTWTRLFIVSAAGDLPDKQATTTRLLQNQADIGDAVKPFYGEAAGNKLTGLLRDHILIAADIVTAAKGGNMDAVGRAKSRWFSNADQIADFLSGANPTNWPRSEMRTMMHEHLNLTMEEAVAELHGDYGLSVRKYDQVHKQILSMADMLSDGIISQFPNKVR